MLWNMKRAVIPLTEVQGDKAWWTLRAFLITSTTCANLYRGVLSKDEAYVGLCGQVGVKTNQDVHDDVEEVCMVNQDDGSDGMAVVAAVR